MGTVRRREEWLNLPPGFTATPHLADHVRTARRSGGTSGSTASPDVTVPGLADEVDSLRDIFLVTNVALRVAVT